MNEELKTDNLIYLDNAATTAMCDEAYEALSRALAPAFFNPSARYKQSAGIAWQIDEDRNAIKQALCGADGALYFCSGGTEANNWALTCTKKRKNSRIIVGEGEHDSVFACANELKNQGYDVSFAPILRDGSVDVDAFKALLDEDVALVSIMHVSNETGAINDIARLVKLTRRLAPSAVFHSDGVQAFMKLPFGVRALDVDLYSIAAHKLHGPKGIGALYVKKGTYIKPMILGGGQEKGMRSGTESFPLIHSFATAVEACGRKFDKEYSQILDLREYFCAKLAEQIEGFEVITPLERSVPNILTVAFADVRGEVLQHSLEEDGILVGTGSACATHHVDRFKKLLRLEERYAEGLIRFSFCGDNTKSEVDKTVSAIATKLDALRRYARV